MTNNQKTDPIDKATKKVVEEIITLFNEMINSLVVDSALTTKDRCCKKEAESLQRMLKKFAETVREECRRKSS